MQEEFYKSTSLSSDTLSVLMERNNHSGLWRFCVQYGLLLASAVVVIMAVEKNLHTGFVLGGMLVFAVMTLSMFAIVHETGHNTAFKTRKLNQLVCWLACLPIYYAPTGFRELHFAHHRHTHIPGKDPEISMASQPAPSVTSSWLMYVGFASGLPLLGYKMNMVLGGALGRPEIVWSKFMFYVRDNKRAQLIKESRLAFLVHLGLFMSAIFWLKGLWYLLGALWLGHSFLSIYTMAEHNGLAHEGTILERTRTVKANSFIKWLFWNMPYHAEHHAYPAVPWHALKSLHQELKPELQHVEVGYLHFHQRVMRSLMKGKAFQDT